MKLEKLTARSRERRGAGALLLRAGALVVALCCVSVAAAALAPFVADGWQVSRRGVAGKDLNTVYFVDSKRGWVGGDDGLVLRTEDGGRQWTRQTIDTTDSINDVYFRDREDGYLLAGNRIFMTGDSGQTWREATTFAPSAFGGAMPELYSVRFTSKKRGWVVGSISRRERVVDSLVLYTHDGGQTWLRRSVPTRDELIHLDFVNDRHGWIVGQMGVVLHTTDGGETWTRQRTNSKATLYHVDFRNEKRGWAVGDGGTLLRTNDGGEVWIATPVPVRTTLLSVKFSNDDDGWIAGRGGVILRSGDGGQTWVQQQSNTRQHLYALFLEKKNNWAVGADGLILQYER